jgi:hypothetical protein
MEDEFLGVVQRQSSNSARSATRVTADGLLR